MSVFNKDIENKKPKTVTITVDSLYQMRQIAEKLTQKVYFDGRIHKDDKLPLLTMLSRLKRMIDSNIQLDLFK